ncbi:hypothetical protein Tco_0839193 [Tanacetum coccineum]|uniref:Retroviral polymerase SH3-like domain-containing protein n=1 Tax=Tanacetum coccineum TaxID=301880 RepID=A0ABQ5APY0_9ASTR
MDEWSKSQNVSSEQTDRTEPQPPPQAQTEQVNTVFTRSGKSDDSPKTQKDSPPPIIINNNIKKDKPIKTSKKGYHMNIGIGIKLYEWTGNLVAPELMLDHHLLDRTKVAVPTPKAQKIGPKYVDCIFIGYAKNSSAYRFIIHDSKNPDIQKNAVMESRNASFFENIFPCLTKETGSSSRLDGEVVPDKRQRDDNDLHDERQDQLEEEEVEPRRSKRARTEKSFGPDFVSFMVENKPTSYREAVTSLEGHQWKEAIKSEIDSILQNHTWELVDLPPGCTRPDLAYVVSRLSRYTSNPSDAHWKAMTRVLHYLRYNHDYRLHYDRYPAVIEGYSDANWISDIKDSRSTSGYVFTLGGAAISWKSSKQTVIAKSTMESEFIALDKCEEEAEWLCQFVEDISRWPKPVTAISIHCDSQSAIGRAHSTMYNGKSRHIHRLHNLIQQLLSTGVISIDYVKSKDNIADPFTKGLSRELVSKSSKGMGLKPLKE